MRIHKIEDDYRELDLEPGASLEEVRNSYRELALFWHPDRRNDVAGRASKAHQKMTRINLAYERLRKALSRKIRSRGTARDGGNTNAQPRTTPAGRRRSQGSHEMRTNSLGMKFVSVE